MKEGTILKIYTAGAMEAYAGTNVAELWRKEVKEFFRNIDSNIKIINPTDYYAYGSNLHKSEQEIFKFDLRKVKESDVLFVNLNNIRNSIGTCIECYEAYKSGIPVIGFIDKDCTLEELIKIIHPWIYCCMDRIETGDDVMSKAMMYIKDYYCC